MLQSQKGYLGRCIDSEDVGIFVSGKHIGKVKLTGLVSNYSRTEGTFTIGDMSFWGKGIASYGVAEVVKDSVENHDLNKLFAGAVSSNIGGLRVLEKNNFVLEGLRLEHLCYEG